MITLYVCKFITLHLTVRCTSIINNRTKIVLTESDSVPRLNPEIASHPSDDRQTQPAPFRTLRRLARVFVRTVGIKKMQASYADNALNRSNAQTPLRN